MKSRRKNNRKTLAIILISVCTFFVSIAAVLLALLSHTRKAISEINFDNLFDDCSDYDLE